MFRWFENRIDPFAPTTIAQPPGILLSFFWHFVRPIWPAFALLFFFDFLAALSEVALAAFVGILIDLMKAAESPAAFLGDHAGLLLSMAFVVIIARPTIVFGYELMKSQVLSPPFQTRARWQTHSYMLRQSLSFFQNDFAGRVANKLMQTAPAMRDSIVMLSDAAVFVSVQWISSLVLFVAVDTLLAIPLLVWLVAYGVYGWHRGPSHLALRRLVESTMWDGPLCPPCAYSDRHRSEVDRARPKLPQHVRRCSGASLTATRTF
jgi:ATP-binding cassette subfamily B multidrug efflux pump